MREKTSVGKGIFQISKLQSRI